MVLNNVNVLFCNVLNEDDFSNKYQVVVQLTEEQAADAEEQGIKLKTKEYDGKTQYQAVFKSQFRPRVVGQNPKVAYDMEGNELGRGSLVNVQFSFRQWKNEKTKQSGVSQDLVGIQVLKGEDIGSSEFDDLSAPEENEFSI